MPNWFQSGCTILYYYWQCMRDPLSHQHLLFSILLFILIYWVWGLSSYGFDLHSSNDRRQWASFHVLICHLYIFFGEMSAWVLCPSFNEIVFLLLNCKFFLIFWIQALYHIHDLQSFYFVNCVLWSIHIINFDEIQFFYFFSCHLCSWCPLYKCFV